MCQKPVKPLNGPPTMRLVHSRVNARVVGSKVPVASAPLAVGFGAASSHSPDTQSHTRSACSWPGALAPVLSTGFGAPWLKFWLFHDAAHDERSAVSFPSFNHTIGGATSVLVCRSTLLVETLNLTPKNF